jgi:hypothetical protein
MAQGLNVTAHFDELRGWPPHPERLEALVCLLDGHGPVVRPTA